MTILQDFSDSFVHLHLHTQYSLLDGAIRIPDLVKKAQEFNVAALAQTDHGNMFGAIDFYTRCKKAGIKPILGSEVYFTPGSRFDRKAPLKNRVLDSQDAEESKHHIHHLILLCKNNVGYRNLCQLISKAYLEGFYYKPRIDIELLKEFHEGLICTTACLKGEVGYNFFSGQDELAKSAIEKLYGLFGEDFYLEIQENGIPEQKIVNQKVIEYARQHKMNLVATNDCHYLTREDAVAQEVLLCIQTSKTFSDEQRMKLTTNEFYFKSPQEMRKAFEYAPDACDNTLVIADKCNVELKWTDEAGDQIYHLPHFEIHTGESTNDFFRRMCVEGLKERFEGPQFLQIKQNHNWESTQKALYEQRLHDEIEMIIRMGFPGYFLIVSDFIKWAKENGIPVGPGRGSGAGSLVAYALKITNINPIPFNLLFERFINPERVSLPDFDVDFCQDRRNEVISYVTKKYGEDRVGQIITFGQLKAKAVIRDVSRVYCLPYSEADALAKLIPEQLGITLKEALELEPKLQEMIDTDPKIRQIFNISERLENLLRHASIHAAGVIITNEPLVHYCPLFKGKEGERVVQYDKNFSELIGLVKFDFLGLKTLSVIDRAVAYIKRDHDSLFDIEEIDLEDKNVYEFISQGKTAGVFQLESAGMIDLCKRLKPTCLEDITAVNALYRPGPLGSGMVDDFIDIKHGRKEMKFPFKELAPILSDTYGVIVYQEQVMNVARIVASYTLGQADMLRRAMGKKKLDEMNKHREIFLEGARKNHFDLKVAGDLYDTMAKFAEYGFNKSHAVAYALIAYQTAFLKKYYPAAFFAATLSYELSNKDKVTAYIADAKKMGLEVLPPDINESLWPFNVVDDNIRFGMGAVKNVGEGAVEAIIAEREKNGPYKGFIDFCERVDHKSVNKRVIESLIKVGAFDQCEQMNRKTLFENLEMVVSYGQKIQEDRAIGQGSLFDMGLIQYEGNEVDMTHAPDYAPSEKLDFENELMGIYVSGHPLDAFEHIISQLSSMTIGEVQEVKGQDKREVTLCGLLSEVRTLVTKKGDKMAFATLEDLSGKIDCVIFPRTFSEYEDLLKITGPLAMRGEVRLNEDPRKLFPTKIQKLEEQTSERVSGIRVLIGKNELSKEKLDRLKQVVLSYKGSVPIHVIIEHQQGRARIQLGEQYLVSPTPQMAAKINAIFEENAVQFVVDGKLEDVKYDH